MDRLKQEHQNWLNSQHKENEEWAAERRDLKDKAHEEHLRYRKQVDATAALEDRLNRTIEERNLQIAQLRGQI